MIALILGLAGCSRKESAALEPYGNVQKLQADYQAAVEDAKRSIPCAAEFAQLFPGAESGFSYYTGGTGPTSFHMETDLYGRYELTMAGILVTFDASRRKVISFGEPEFVLNEVTNLQQIVKGWQPGTGH